MRQFATLTVALLFLLVFALPASAVPLRSKGASQKGWLSLEDGAGLVVINAVGVLFGHLERGQVSVTVTNRARRQPVDAVVTGTDLVVTELDGLTTVYRGKDIFFRIKQGSWRLRVRGQGIDVSAVIRGRVTLLGTSGTVAVSGGDPLPWPEQPQTFLVGS